MKKLILLLPVSCMVFCLAACGNTDDSSTEKVSGSEVADELNVFVPVDPVEIEDIEVLFDYTMADWDSATRYLIVQNNTDETLDVSVYTLAYDAEGEMIASAESETETVAPGCTTVIYSVLETEENVKIDSYDSVWRVLPGMVSAETLQEVWYNADIVDENTAEIQVTNHGEEAVKYPKGYILFLNDGKPVDCSVAFFMDQDFELKGDAKVCETVTSEEEFDSVEVFLTGYGINW